MESQPQNPEFRNNPENFHPSCKQYHLASHDFCCLLLSSCLFVCFVALRPKSTAMVIAGRSVHLTTPFPGQA